jgi:hypothetical protein
MRSYTALKWNTEDNKCCKANLFGSTSVQYYGPSGLKSEYWTAFLGRTIPRLRNSMLIPFSKDGTNWSPLLISRLLLIPLKRRRTV